MIAQLRRGTANGRGGKAILVNVSLTCSLPQYKNLLQKIEWHYNIRPPKRNENYFFCSIIKVCSTINITFLLTEDKILNSTFSRRHRHHHTIFMLYI